MPFKIVTGDILDVHAESVVVAANEQLVIDGGVGLKVALAAGRRKLQRACDAQGGCETGAAVVTPAFSLRASHIVHVVGPIWQGGEHGEADMLAEAYRSALFAVLRAGDGSVAIPLISAGTYGYPADQALSVAVCAIRSFLDAHDLDITLVLYDRDAVKASLRKAEELSRYLDEAHYDRELVARLPDPLAMVEGRNQSYLSSATGQLSAQTSQILAREQASDVEEQPGDVEEELQGRGEPSLPHPIVCPNCGHECVEGAIFCLECGCLLRLTESEKSVAETSDADELTPEEQDVHAVGIDGSFDEWVLRKDGDAAGGSEIGETPAGEEGESAQEAADAVEAHASTLVDSDFGFASMQSMPDAASSSMPDASHWDLGSMPTAADFAGMPIPPELDRDTARMQSAPDSGVLQTAYPPMPENAAVPCSAPIPAKKHGGLFGHSRKPKLGAAQRRADLDAWLQQADESLGDTLLDLIDKRGFTDAQVYKRANISRQVFNKIKNDPGYHPKKPTVLALCVALELGVPETEDVLSRAGYALNPSSNFDLIVRYYISQGCFDHFEINEALFAYDQPLLGAS